MVRIFRKESKEIRKSFCQLGPWVSFLEFHPGSISVPLSSKYKGLGVVLSSKNFGFSLSSTHICVLLSSKYRNRKNQLARVLSF